MAVPKKHVQVGPWGGTGGSYSFEFKPDAKITNIYIKTGGQGGCIDSIRFGYFPAGSSQESQSPKYGGEGGHNSETMYIEADEELVELSGTIGSYNNYTVITSLCFRTNRKSCSFGSESGTKFSLPVKITDTKFVGFHGTYGGYLDSIGAILEPK
ncbi:putative jacalin-like lectin domain-containing protein [Helianthus debilis subsp. tardiflorus]